MHDEHIDILLPRFLSKLREMGYSEESALSRIHRLRKRLRNYMELMGDMQFSRTIGDDYLHSIFDSVSHYVYSQLNRDVNMLIDFMETGEFRKTYPMNRIKFEDYGIGELAQNFINELVRLGRTEGTISGYRLGLRYFTDYLRLNNLNSLDDLTVDIIHNFIGTIQGDKPRYICHIRRFFSYLDEEDIFPNNFHETMPQINKFPRCDKLPAAYNKEEIGIIERSVERISNLGLRNYAMLLLSTRLGLRISDIAHLRFQDIDWDNNTINIVQFKTKNLVELPLTKDVGEAIIAYAKVRPISSEPEIFLSERPPYPRIKTQTTGIVIAKIIAKSGVNTINKRSGAHSMRHSLASNMLKDGITLPVISEVLGHTSTESTRNYLRIDYTSLINCALEVPRVPDSFYNQGGGAFYD